MTRARDNSNILGTSGTNGQVLTIDTNQNNGYAFENPAQYAAGKNKIINGDFNIWQRGTSFSGFSASYTADRWGIYSASSGATITTTQQSFTPGSAPVAGYESAYYIQIAQTVAGTGGNLTELYQRIEDVRTFAGQTVTVSFWAKADTSRTVTPAFEQWFNSSGTPTVNTLGSPITVGTSWARYSQTISIPSIAGYTITAGQSFLQLDLQLAPNTVQTLSFWGVQVERGSVATPFTTATGTLQGELAACQRYYVRFANGSVYATYGYGNASSSTLAYPLVNLPVSMRVAPTILEYSTLQLGDTVNAASAVTNLTVQNYMNNQVILEATVSSGLTTYRPYQLRNANSTSGYLGFIAEL